MSHNRRKWSKVRACDRRPSEGLLHTPSTGTQKKKWEDDTALQTNNLPQKDVQFAISMALCMDVTLKSSLKSKHAAQQK